jgi:hypothetical protein
MNIKPTPTCDMVFARQIVSKDGGSVTKATHDAFVSSIASMSGIYHDRTCAPGADLFLTYGHLGANPFQSRGS